MQLNKTLGEILYRLFGENGSNAIVGERQLRDMAVYRELERHGIVRLVPRKNMEGLFDVIRVCKSNPE